MSSCNQTHAGGGPGGCPCSRDRAGEPGMWWAAVRSGPTPCHGFLGAELADPAWIPTGSAPENHSRRTQWKASQNKGQRILESELREDFGRDSRLAAKLGGCRVCLRSSQERLTLSSGCHD